MMIISLVVLLVLGSCQGYETGFDKGRVRGACSVRAEYARTAPDTLAVARTYPECRDILFPNKLPASTGSDR